MRVAHHTGELHFENLVEDRDNLVFVELCHKTAFLMPYEIDAVNPTWKMILVLNMTLGGLASSNVVDIIIEKM